MENKKEFIAYLQSKDFAERSITNNVKYVAQFFEKMKKEAIQITKPDILKFLEYLKNKGFKNAYRSYYLSALKHYFNFLYQEKRIAQNPCLFLKIRGTRKIIRYKIYTPEELDELFDNYYSFFVRGYDISHIPKNVRKEAVLSKERNALALSFLIYQGATTTEIENIELKDIDLIKAVLQIHGRRKLNSRTLPLKATQIGLLMNYLQNIRPQILEYQTKESEKLLLPLPEVGHKKTDKDITKNVFARLSMQLKSIDKQFLNVVQLRASVITFWLKTQGLRKTQYLAGHRQISTTEKYLPNNLDSLTDDINKLHPFL
jgi:site-specific recombinase XerD